MERCAESSAGMAGSHGVRIQLSCRIRAITHACDSVSSRSRWLFKVDSLLRGSAWAPSLRYLRTTWWLWRLIIRVVVGLSGYDAGGVKLVAKVRADAADQGRSCDAACSTKPAPSHASSLSSRAIYVILGNLVRQAQEQHRNSTGTAQRSRSGLANTGYFVLHAGSRSNEHNDIQCVNFFIALPATPQTTRK
jgi:hypothetical protein